MRSVFLLTIMCGLFSSLNAEEESEYEMFSSKFPVEVSFLAVDMKYHEERGVQICEIQQGVPSTFKGERFSNRGVSLIASNLITVLGRYYQTSWYEKRAFADKSVIKNLGESDAWRAFSTLSTLKKDKEFLLRSSMPVYDPNDLYSYHGFVFMSPLKNVDRGGLIAKYPGVVFIDNANYLFRKNKLAMSELLNCHPLLIARKPMWKGYIKKYSSTLADEIIKDIDSELFVIKPLGMFMGKGVIIVSRNDLDITLQYILGNTNEVPPGYDPSFDEWFKDREKHFIVEEFIDVNPVAVPHLGGELYSPTLRLVFLLIYDQKQIEVVSLGGYYSLPKKALSEEGTLNEKYKSYCKLPYYCQADPEVMKKAEAEMKEALTILYKIMLSCK